MVLRKHDRLSAGIHSQLLENPRDVIAYRLLADEELSADIDVRAAFGDSYEYLALAPLM
jgi:hypothetical protein